MVLLVALVAQALVVLVEMEPMGLQPQQTQPLAAAVVVLQIKKVVMAARESSISVAVFKAMQHSQIFCQSNIYWSVAAAEEEQHKTSQVAVAVEVALLREAALCLGGLGPSSLVLVGLVVSVEALQMVNHLHSYAV